MEMDLELARFALDRAVVGILHVSLDGALRYANDFIVNKLGYSRDELSKMTIFDINPTLTPQSWPAHSQRFLKPGSTSFETVHRRKSGVTFPVEVTVQHVEYRGEPFFLACSRDLSEQKLAEAERERLRQELGQAQKLESLGRLAGGIAHDFNNLLSIILLGSEALLDEVTPAQRERLDEIRDAAVRSGELTNQLLTFARKRALAPRALDLGQAIDSMSKMLGRLIGGGFELRLVRPPELGPVAIDDAQLNQLVANLVLNARDACGDKGTITVEVRDVDAHDALLASHGVSTVPSVLLSVSDTGQGMTREVLEHLFEPFFTTKQPGRGTGLGLATVFGIVSQHDGAIRVESAVGQGTTFRCFFPRATRSAHAPLDTLAPTHSEPVGTETILVVEDEPAVLRLTQGVLETLGYRVLAASGPREAMKLAETEGAAIALVVTDLAMPEVSGVELVAALRERWPGRRALYVSGHSAEATLRLDAQTGHLQKPVLRAALAQKVREMLDR